MWCRLGEGVGSAKSCAPSSCRFYAWRMSWDEQFADRYDQWSAPMTADIPFYVELAVQANGPLVELAVGNGRVAVPVARRCMAGIRSCQDRRAQLLRPLATP